MKSGSKWTRDELLLVINLYYRIPFGRQHSRAPEVVGLAEMLGRTPGSVAMKLNNITSLDPEESLRGVHGLQGASSLDLATWKEFQDNWELVSAESEGLWTEQLHKVAGTGQNTEPSQSTQEAEYGSVWDASNPTEKMQPTKVRLAQSFFRKVVLSAYSGRCCVTGIPIPELLIASHILPWSTHPEHRADPRNGLCLSRLHDAAFDKGLITFDEKNRLVLSATIKEHLTSAVMNYSFALYEGKTITIPERFAPNPDFMAIHRETNFAG